MAEIRHLENRLDVIFLPWSGWNLADWCRMTCRLRWYRRSRNRKYNSNMADVCFFQTGNSYILAVDWVITTKFGLLLDTDVLKRATSPNPKPRAKLRCSAAILKTDITLHHVCAADGTNWIKFGYLVQNDMPSTVTWSKSKAEVEF